MTWLPARLAAVTAVAAIFIGSGPAPAAESAPAPRAVYPRFDLTYLPAIGPQGLLGFRPAEIARHAKGPELGNSSRQLFQQFFEHVADGDPTAAEPPAFADIEQCVFNLGAVIASEPGGEHGAAYLGGQTPCVIRAVRPLDWTKLVRKWFPKSSRARYAGRNYTRVPCRELPKGAPPFAVYAADDRTMVCGTEPDIRTLLDRLAAGRPAPTPPPGWGEVDREFAAFVLDNRTVSPLKGTLSPDRPVTGEFAALIDSLDTVTVAVSVGDRSSVRIMATARDERHAKIAAYSLRRLLELAGETTGGLAGRGLFESMAAEAVENFALERKGLRISGGTSARGNPIKMLLVLLHGQD